MRLEDFPRPPEDNGRGLHWSLSPYPPVGSALDFWIDELLALHIKWVKVVDNGKGSSLPLCRRLLQEGMMPIVRIDHTRPMPRPLSEEQKKTILRLIDAGVRYIELDSEPDLPAEWGGTRPPHWFDILIDTFIQDADFVLEHGGLPAIPAMELSPAHNPVRAIVERGRADLFERGTWWAIHSYTLNRPLEYPDDPVNRAGTPVSPQEYHKHYPWGWEEPVEVINQWRAEGVQPHSTLADDPHCFRNYELAGALAREVLGHPIPVISTEGGAVTGWRDDRRYPRLDPWTAAEWTVRINEFLQGSAPPWYFTLCHWLMAEQRLDPGRPEAWESHCWYTHYWDRQFGFRGELPVVAHVKAMPSHPRDIRPAKEPSMTRTQVYGVILDAQGHPVGDLTLRVLQEGEEITRFTTTPDGRFHVLLPKGGTYTLTLEDGKILETFPIETGQTQELRIQFLGEPSEEPVASPSPPEEAPAVEQVEQVEPLAEASLEEEEAEETPPPTEEAKEERGEIPRPQEPTPPAAEPSTPPETAIYGTLPGARPGLRLELSDQEGRTWEYTLDEEGQFAFTHLPPGTYTLTLTGVGLIAKDIVLREGDRVEIWFPMRGGIQGLVMGGSPDMTATLVAETYGWRRVIALSPQGQYRFVELPPGTYTVHIGEHTLGPVDIDGDSMVTLAPLDLRPPHRAGIKGKVQDEKGQLLPDIPVRLLQRGTLVAETTTALNGQYTLENLPEGEYQLIVLGPHSEVIQTVQLVQDEILEYNITLQAPVSFPEPAPAAEEGREEQPPVPETPPEPEESAEAPPPAQETPSEPEEREKEETVTLSQVQVEEAETTQPSAVPVEPEPEPVPPPPAAEIPSEEPESKPVEEAEGEIEEAPAPEMPAGVRRIDTYLLLPPPEHPLAQAAILAAIPFLRQSRAVAGFRVEEAMHAQRVLIIGDETIYDSAVEEALRKQGCDVDRVGGDPATWIELFRASARALAEGAGK